MTSLKTIRFLSTYETVLLCVSLSLWPLLASTMYSMFQTQQMFPRQCSFAIENLLEVANITEAMEGASEKEDILAKISQVGDNSICCMGAVVPWTCITKL